MQLIHDLVLERDSVESYSRSALSTFVFVCLFSQKEPLAIPTTLPPPAPSPNPSAYLPSLNTHSPLPDPR